MVYLTEKYWESFKKDSNSKVFDGNKFEKLVLSILKEIFNGQWEATQQTWDGGKDFYQKNDLYLDWAECKIHKDNIDIKTIGKTLVMAIIEENVKKIFFFSYSPMVSTAYKHLATFSKNSNINIIAYDDIKLEELILNTTTTKKHYFNDFPLGNYPFNKKDTIHTNISKDIDISILEVENLHKHKNRIEKFLYNQTFMLEIIIINNSIDEKKYEFDFSDFTNSEIKLWLLSDIDSEKYNNFKLAGCEVKSIVIFLKSRKVGKTTIPQIKINSPANNDSVTQIYTQKKDIEVAFISHPIFVSLKLEEVISKFESCISSNNKLELHVIFGSSGVGKSRLSLEFRDKLLRQNYSIFQYDCNSLEYYLANTFSQKLLSYLYKVPIVHDKTENSKFNLLTSLINGNNTVNKHNMNDIVGLIIVGIKIQIVINYR